VNLTLDIDEDDIVGVLKGLQNEAARLRVISHDGSAHERLAHQSEAKIKSPAKKPVQRETVTQQKEKQRGVDSTSQDDASQLNALRLK